MGGVPSGAWLSCRPVHFVRYADLTIPRALPGGGWRTALARPTETGFESAIFPRSGPTGVS